MTDVLRVSATDPEAEPIARAAHCIRNGGLVAFPTETVYGLGAHALDHRAVARIFAAKGRPSTDPLIVHVLNLEAAAPLVADPPATLRVLAERYWPGPLTLIVPRSAAVPDAVTAGRHTVALRSPAHPVARALLRASAVPIAAPSANLFSHPSPTSAAHVLHDLGGRVDIVLDGGSTQVGVESTIVDLSTDPPELLRPGAIGLAELQRLIPTLVSRTVRAAGDVALASPGTLARHYSPRTPLRLFDGSRHEALDGIARAVATAQGAHRRVALLVFDGDRPALTSSGMPLVTLGEERDAGSVAARLYGALRECDALGCDQILCRLPETHDTHPLWPAIVDRLRRAATAG